MTPDQYPHRVLIVVSGMSPQVLTETVYALAHQQPAFVPTEVHLVSTRSGARHARLSLLEGDSQFLRLCLDYHLDASMFSAARIHVITDADDQPLDDIRTPADNDAAADYITCLVREHTARDDAAVHVSMAGGRKTMGYYAGYALSLYGRDQDRLSHVLVSEGFEGHREFYYPTPDSRPVYRQDGATLDAAEARVDLADIPFVRLRDELPDKVRKASALLGGRQGFSQAVAAAEAARSPHLLALDLANLEFTLDGQPLEGLGSANLSLLAWLAWRQDNGVGDLHMREVIKDGKALGQEYGRFCQYLQDRDDRMTAAERRTNPKARGRLPELGKVIDAVHRAGFESRDDLDPRMSSLRTALRKTLGNRLAEQFTPLNFGGRGEARYSLVDFDNRFRVVPPLRAI